MFDEFQQEVLAKYRDLRDRHELPSGLENLKRSNLRRCALWVLANKYNRKDDEVIKQFFDRENRYTNHEERIRRFELDKFRSLISFLKGECERTDDWNIKILAWLIDFEPRPYSEWRRIRSAGSGTTVYDDGEDIGEGSTPLPPKPPPTPLKPETPLTTYKLFGYIAGITLLAGLVAYFVIGRPECLDKQCMYWFNDRYVAVCCGKQLPGVAIVAINPHELEHFRKITRPDTLTAELANKVWYSKIDNNVEFFTAPAAHHPVHPGRPIKPATAYIIEKYAGQAVGTPAKE